MGNTIALGLVSSYFNMYYDVAMNIIGTAVPLGIMVSAPVTQLFIDIYGWRSTLILFGGLNLHYIAAAVVLKPSNPIQTDEKRILYKPLSKESDDVQSSECRNVSSICFGAKWNVSLFRNGRFLVVLAVSIGSGYLLNGWVVYLVSIVQSKGLSPHDAASVATISGVGAILVRTILSIIKGKTYHRELLFTSIVLAIISYGGMYFATSFWLLSLFSVTLGISYGFLGIQIYIWANDIVGKDDAVGAVAWIHLAYGVGYIASGYISGKFHLSYSILSTPVTFPLRGKIVQNRMAFISNSFLFSNENLGI